MAIDILSDEELTRLDQALPGLIADPNDITRAIEGAGINLGSVLRIGATVPQTWHQALHFASVHGKLPALLMQINEQLAGRMDAVTVLRLISIAIERNVSVVLAEDVKQLRTRADDLLGDHDPNVAARGALRVLRPPVRHIQEKLDDERFWPILFPGLNAEEARTARELLSGRCLDTLRSIDALVMLHQLAGSAPSSTADDQDRWRLERLQNSAMIDAKYAVVKALLMLHQELTRCLPIPLGGAS